MKRGLVNGNSILVTNLKTLANDPRPHVREKLSDDVYLIRVGNIRIIYYVNRVEKYIDVCGFPD
jgi:mRNA-degrading endonuclease RelE of RelBE toxin-antitoxin system